jgi:3-oxoacyl-[acyl-carrier-protein] synthase-3
MSPEDIDLMIVSSLRPDTIGVGNAAYLSAELGLRGAAWNLETACSSSVVGLQTANAVIKAGDYRNVLVVTSCTYSRDADESDSLAWFLGDGAGAFVVCPSKGPDGVLGSKTVHTADTCGAFYYDMIVGPDQVPRFRMNADAKATRVLRDSAMVYLRECCDGALDASNMRLSDIDFFVFNTPTAWYAKFCARAMGIDVSRTIDTYPLYANIGPALMPSNLYRAARSNKIRKGDVVLLYAIGSSSTASATVMRWGDVTLGPDPEEAVVG